MRRSLIALAAATMLVATTATPQPAKAAHFIIGAAVIAGAVVAVAIPIVGRQNACKGVIFDPFRLCS